MHSASIEPEREKKMVLERRIDEINKKLEDKSISKSERDALMQELDENLYMLKERNSDEY